VTNVPRGADVVVVGAGIVGAACAAALARSGLHVCVIDRADPAAGSSSSGEGNLLVSDKLPGPELELALHSLALWREFAQTSETPFEFEGKGGLVVAGSAGELAVLHEVAAGQHHAGVRTQRISASELGELEPYLARDLAGGVFYPDDCQVQPMRAVRALLRSAVRDGAQIVTGCDVVGVQRGGDHVTGVRTSRGVIAVSALVIAAGAFTADVARLAGVELEVVPRRGHVLVTEPLPPMVRHKVYEAGYVADVESDEAGLLSSSVVEGTQSGPILLGSTRELTGFDHRFDMRAATLIAQRAVRLFPFLADVRIIRGYLGFRPATPDHLPIIGTCPAAPGVWFATGHEGAGVGLSMATADLIRAQICGAASPLDATPFTPDRATLTVRAVHG
jgi:glycine/D-amino acid oxidase-like deaminating enzyme